MSENETSLRDASLEAPWGGHFQRTTKLDYVTRVRRRTWGRKTERVRAELTIINGTLQFS